MEVLAFKKQQQVELKVLAVRLLPILVDKIEAQAEIIIKKTGYSHDELLLKQIQFLYRVLDVQDISSDFLSAKLVINPTTKEVFKEHMLDALKIVGVSLSMTRNIKQKIIKIHVVE